jgi:Type II CAAX prenyl endopeptidase Rce1-like
MASLDRARRGVLITAAGRVASATIVAAAGIAWGVGCVAAIWRLMYRVHVISPAAHVAVGAGVLAATGLLTLRRHPLRRLRRMSTWRGAGRLVAASTAAFVVLVLAARVPLRIVATSFGNATLAAAVGEEAVFRGIVPKWVARQLARARMRRDVAQWSGALIAQLSFAAAHGLNRDVGATASGVAELARLFVLGMLYHHAALAFGLWAAAGIHGALNLVLATSAGGWRGVASLPAAGACGSYAICALLMRRQYRQARARRRRERRALAN